MFRRPGLTVLVVAVSLLTALPRRTGASAATAQELARASMTAGRALEYASELTALGPRVTGSASYQRAAEWAADRFRTIGLTGVVLEPFTLERGWERVSARARIVAPSERPLHVASLGWMPSTPEGGFDADVVALDRFSLDAIAARRALQGRIVLLPDGDPPGAPAQAARTRSAVAVALRAAGVLAMLAADSDAGNQLSARGFGFTTAIGVLPAAQIGREDAQLIRDLLARGPVRLSLELINRTTPAAATAMNVVADLPARERSDEMVIVGAHLDAWDFGAGAQDNATGVAMVLEAARAIVALHAPPLRTIRFALWGGEEQGQVGSTAYVRAHAPLLDRVVAHLNTDAGTGRVIGWTAPGRPEVIRAVRPLTQAALRELEADTFDDSLRYAFQSDGAPFIRAGIPTLDLNADDTKYEEIHHKAADTMDRVDARNLAIGAAAVAATAYAIADAPRPIAARRRPPTKGMD
jgi:carboxypeptidase Q